MENKDCNLEPKSEKFASKDKETSSASICYFYAQHQFCKYGNRCKYIHPRKEYSFSQKVKDPPLKDSDTVQVSKTEKYPRRVFHNSDKRNTKISVGSSHTEMCPKQNIPLCRYYKSGRCNYGNDCSFNHNEQKKSSDSRLVSSVKENTPKVVNKKKRIPVCWYFQRGNCRKSDLCQYFHPGYHLGESSSKEIFNNTSAYVSFERTPAILLGSQHTELGSDIVNETPVKLCQGNENFCSTDILRENPSTDPNLEFSLSNLEISGFKNSKDSANVDSLVDLSPDFSIRKEITGKKHSDVCNFFKGGESILKPSEDHNLNCTNHFASDSTSSSDVQIERLSCIRNTNIKKTYSLLSMNENEIQILRNTEISQLKKRYPHLEVVEDDESFCFEFQPTDPDWPFDLQNLKVLVHFPGNYPLEVCQITVLETTGYMPERLHQYLNQSVSDWLQNRHQTFLQFSQVELLFRPFLKWFDRNLEDLLKQGLKKEQLEEEVHVISSISASGTVQERVEDSSIAPQTSTEQLEVGTDQITVCEKTSAKNTPPSLNQSQGVKVLFGELEFVEGVAAMSCTRISITLQCGRCKTLVNLKSMPNKNYNLTCSKCSRDMSCNFNPSILHPFSNILGSLYLTECRPVDLNLVECVFLMDCLSCSKQVTVDSIHYGQKQKLWCKFCNQKFLVGIGSVKFQASVPTHNEAKATVKIISKSVKKKDPLIKEGHPLPELGACKHYKKSNRWLRFPCCGRVYPCDVCHDEKETDHDMKFASRMICGFCAKEQPYSKEKPCISCSSGMVAKSSAHWEGGKGCRNKVKMSRDDKHKFAGTNKTTSKKAQNTGSKKKK